MGRANLQLVVAPKIKELARRAAVADRRTMSALVELLIRRHCPVIIQNSKNEGLDMCADLLEGEPAARRTSK